MKKIIYGKVFNTETAELIAEWASNNGSYNFVSEQLFKTKKGNWFVFGESGPMGAYSKTDGDTAYGSWDIFQVDEETAYNFLEEHSDQETIEKLFPGRLEEA